MKPFLVFSMLLLAVAGSAVAGSIPMDYALDLRSGTINGSPLTNVVIFESGAGQTSATYGLVAPSSGAFVLNHFASFVPSSTLIIGMDVPVGAGTTHIVVFGNQAFVNSSEGQRWRTMFPSASYSTFTGQLTQASAGDAAARAWMMNFFQGDGAVAAFGPGTRPAAIEFSTGVIPAPVAAVPEPMTYGLMGLGLALMAGVRRRLEHVRRSATRANVDTGDRHPTR